MGTDGWRSSRSLNEQLNRDFGGFDYYQLVRLLRARGGRVRFRGDLSAAFPGREVSAVENSHRGVTLRTPNYTLAGGVSPLPDPFADWVRERVRVGDRAMAEFLDLFTDGINQLRFRVKEQLDPALEAEHPEAGRLAHYLGNLVGLWGEDLRGRRPLPLRALLGIAGLLADHRRSGPAITRVLRLYLEAPVALEQLRGRWLEIDEEERTHLGTANHTLGQRTVLGSRMWDAMGAIGIKIGPLPYRRFRQLLPGGEDHVRLAGLLRLLTRRRVDCQIELTLDPAERPPAKLSGDDDEPGVRLDQSAWLGRRVEGGDEGGDEGREGPYTVRFTIPAFDPDEQRDEDEPDPSGCCANGQSFGGQSFNSAANEVTP